MAMFNNLRTKLGLRLLGKSWTPADPALAEFFQGSLSAFPMPGQPVYTELTLSKAVREGYKMAVPVYRGIRAIVQAASGIPWKVVDKNGEEIENHPFTLAWARPNPEFSGQDNMEFIIAHLILVGNSLIQPIPALGQPKEFWVAMPDRIKPIPSRDRNKWLDGYKFIDVDGVEKTLPKETFIHFMQFDPGNPYWGTGALLACGRVVDTFNEAQDTQKLSMQNRGMPSGILVPEQPMDKVQFEEAQRRIKELYLEKATRREPWLVSRNLKWQETSLTPVEMDYLNSQKFNVRLIASAIGIDPWWLGDREYSAFNNVREARKSLYQDTALPMLDDIRATLNFRVAPLYGGDIHITYDISNIPALREEFGDKVNQAKNLWSMGVPFEQINDKLELGFEEFEGWEVGYLPFSVMPVGSTPPEPKPQPGQGGEAGEEGEKAMKAFNLQTEEQKAGHWKRIDQRRVAYWGLLQRKFQPLYTELGDAAAKAVTGKPDKLVAKVSEAINKQAPAWEKMLTAVALVLIEDFGEDTAEQLKSPPHIAETKAFDPYSAAVRSWVAKHAAEGVKSILDTQRESMAKIIQDGVEKDLPNTTIAKNLRQFYTDNAKFMAMRVARTETGAAAGFGQSEAARQSGVAKKKYWITCRDDRVRDFHVMMEGEERDFEERYSNGLMYPGDTSGPPEEFIMCRCTEGYKV